MIADTTRRFVDNEVTPRIAQLEQHDWRLQRDLISQAADLGLIGANIPTAYGGLALDHTSGALIAENLGRCISFATTLLALAVTSKKRIEAAPDVPTFEEAGVPGYEAIGWFGVVAPRGTPRSVIGKLNSEIKSALDDPEIRARAIAAGTEPLATTPEEFAAMIREETKKWAEVIKAGNIRLQ